MSPAAGITDYIFKKPLKSLVGRTLKNTKKDLENLEKKLEKRSENCWQPWPGHGDVRRVTCCHGDVSLVVM